MMNERRVTVVGKALTSIKSKGFCSSGDYGTVLVRTIDSSVADTASAAIPVDDDD